MPSLTPDLLATFAALLFAHLLADFVLQTRGMVDNKRNPFVFLLHIAIHGAVTWVALGGLWAVALFVALSHFVIDVIKTFLLPDRLWAFCSDQISQR